MFSFKKPYTRVRLFFITIILYLKRNTVDDNSNFFFSEVWVKDWSGNPFGRWACRSEKRLKRKAWWAFWRKRPYNFLYSSYSLSWNKETKFKAVSNHAKNKRLSSRRFELASLKHQIVFAPTSVFDAPLFFTHHLIRPRKNDIQI